MKKMLCTFLLLTVALAAAAQKGHDITIKLTEKANKEPIMMATCQLNPLGAYAVTDIKGNAVLKNIPEGTYTLVVSYVGFETISHAASDGGDLPRPEGGDRRGQAERFGHVDECHHRPSGHRPPAGLVIG